MMVEFHNGKKKIYFSKSISLPSVLWENLNSQATSPLKSPYLFMKISSELIILEK